MSLADTFAAGILLGLSLAAPPGPVNALMASRSARGGWWPGARVGLGAATADTLFLVLAYFGAIAVLGTEPGVTAALSLVGSGIMLHLAWTAWRSARSVDLPVESRRTGGYVAGFAIAATSPFNFAWWIGAGSPLLSTFGPTLGVGLVVGILAWVTSFPAAIAAARRRWPAVDRWVSYVSAAILAAFAFGLAASIVRAWI